jgi:hypothetical protein
VILTNPDGTSVTKTNGFGYNMPTVSITSPLANSYITALNMANFTLTGNCSENGRSVVISALGIPSTMISCASNGWTANLNLTNATVSGGQVTIAVSHSNSAGDSVFTARTFNWNTTTPTVAFTTPVSGSYINNLNKAAFTINGTCSENGQVINVTGTASANPTCNSGGWTVTLNLSSVSDGSVDLIANHSNLAGVPAAPANIFL